MLSLDFSNSEVIFKYIVLGTVQGPFSWTVSNSAGSNPAKLKIDVKHL